MKKDFNILEETGGIGKAIIKSFTAIVTSNTLIGDPLVLGCSKSQGCNIKLEKYFSHLHSKHHNLL